MNIYFNLCILSLLDSDQKGREAVIIRRRCFFGYALSTSTCRKTLSIRVLLSLSHLGRYSNSREYGAEALAYAWKWCLKLLRNVPYAQSVWQTWPLPVPGANENKGKAERGADSQTRDRPHTPRFTCPCLAPPAMAWCHLGAMDGPATFPQFRSPASLPIWVVCGRPGSRHREGTCPLPGAMGCRCTPSSYLLLGPSHGDKLSGGSLKTTEGKPCKYVNPNALPLRVQM